MNTQLPLQNKHLNTLKKSSHWGRKKFLKKSRNRSNKHIAMTEKPVTPDTERCELNLSSICSTSTFQTGREQKDTNHYVNLVFLLWFIHHSGTMSGDIEQHWNI